MILECPRCLSHSVWNRTRKPAGPGPCRCKTLLPWRRIRNFREDMRDARRGEFPRPEEFEVLQ
jgi:hypothetical protein